MRRRARGQLKGPLAIVGLALLTAAGAPSAQRTGPGAEVVATGVPLSARVVSVRRESADSIRVELTLANLAAAETWRDGSPEATAVHAAVAALEEASVLSADGRRRLFALRGSSGQRVGSPMTAPVPGHPQNVWTLFPAADGPVSLLLPGFAPLPGLAVAAAPERQAR